MIRRMTKGDVVLHALREPTRLEGGPMDSPSGYDHDRDTRCICNDVAGMDGPELLEPDVRPVPFWQRIREWFR